MSNFLCLDCKVHTSNIGEYYMLNDKLWEDINPNKTGMLCIGCAENRIGRKLIKADFMNVPINDGVFTRSDRMLNRRYDIIN